MTIRSLNLFLKPRWVAVRARNAWLRYVGGISVGSNVNLSLSARLRVGRRGSIVIGSETLIAFKTWIFSYDDVSGQDRPVKIGHRCFIGGGSMILPGVTIGDGCIVGAGSVVFDDAPAGSIIAGNPARILQRDIVAGAFGRLPHADENTRRLWGGEFASSSGDPHTAQSQMTRAASIFRRLEFRARLATERRWRTLTGVTRI